MKSEVNMPEAHEENQSYSLTEDGKYLFLNNDSGFSVYQELSREQALDALSEYLPSK